MAEVPDPSYQVPDDVGRAESDLLDARWQMVLELDGVGVV